MLVDVHVALTAFIVAIVPRIVMFRRLVMGVRVVLFGEDTDREKREQSSSGHRKERRFHGLNSLWVRGPQRFGATNQSETFSSA